MKCYYGHWTCEDFPTLFLLETRTNS
jgi:hypothetical protein